MLFRLVVFITSIVLLSACTNDLKDVMRLPKRDVSPSQIGDSVTMLYTDSAQLKIMLKANRMLVYNKNVSEPLTVMPKGVFVTFFDQYEKVSATLKAGYAVRYEQSNLMEVKFGVEVLNQKGEKLKTEKLVWDENKQRIYTDAEVTVSTTKEIIKGIGLESNQDFSKYELKQITGIIQLNNNEYWNTIKNF